MPVVRVLKRLGPLVGGLTLTFAMIGFAIQAQTETVALAMYVGAFATLLLTVFYVLLAEIQRNTGVTWDDIWRW